MKRLSFYLLISIISITCQQPNNKNMNNSETSSSTPKVELLIDCKNLLGEGAIWNHKTQEFWWIDIEGKALHIYHPASKEQRKIDVGQRIGTVVPTTLGSAAIALQSGVYELDLESEEQVLISDPEDESERIRLNDGKCDPAGRFWVGSMHLDQMKDVAGLYRIESKGETTKMLDSITISNGIIWSLDEKTMYYIDTPDQNVKAFDYDKSTGDISNQRVVIEVPESMGFPDGMAIDEEGMLWIALWNGNAVSRWNPNTGELLSKIEVPAHNVASCAFGGENLDILYITSARVDMTEDELTALPLSGGVFTLKPGVKGVNSHFFALSE